MKITLPNLKTYSEVAAMKTVWSWGRTGSEMDRTGQSPEIDPQACGELILTGYKVNSEKGVFSTNSVGATGFSCAKISCSKPHNLGKD